MNGKSLTLLGLLAVGASLAAGQARPWGAQPVAGSGSPSGVAAYGGLSDRAAHAPAHAPVLESGIGHPMPAPLVAAKFLVPKGVRVTAYPGTTRSRIYEAPVVLGLRPGYVYRFELSNLPFRPGQSLFPEIEVRGTLVPRPGMKYMDYPIPIALSEADIERVLKGVVITKVVYLEDPEKALPTEVGRDAVIEMPDTTESDAIQQALANGRLMAIIRVGNLKPTAEQLQPLAIDGTILLPGEKKLPSPAIPPSLPIGLCPMYDPLLGPKGPKEECFIDGGDKEFPLGIGRNGQLGGLDPTDVAVEFTIGGKRQVTTSNVVCICSPRFMIRRSELLPSGFEQARFLAAHVGVHGPGLFRDRQAAMVGIGSVRTGGVQGSVRASGYVGKVGLSFYIGSTRPLVVGQVDGLKVTAAVVEPEQLTAYPTLCPLTVTKSVDPPGPKEPGEVVTITIRYANTGTKPVSDLVVSDNLSPRLEYIPGSAQTDRPANFSAAENEVGSLILRWELPGVLLPGQTGTVKFKAKVR
ncbi:MAG: hypothetical protein RMJ56_09040 [Gemmataceae bacterium]|nr:DUF11 domain-containing protein [Gemmata sp.]MDW8197732.1 hypothetical protein [Gemmataceae bacterium]